MNAKTHTSVVNLTAYEIRQANLAANGPVSDLIRGHEAVKLKPYRDRRANGEDVGLAIGVGHNLDQLPITERVAELLYLDDLTAFLGRLGKWSVYLDCNAARQGALADMAFTMGPAKLMRFPRMIGGLMRKNWLVAGVEAIDSDWWDHQPRQRRTEVVSMLITGLWGEQYCQAERRLRDIISVTSRNLAKDCIADNYTGPLGDTIKAYVLGVEQFEGMTRAVKLRA